MEKLFTVKELAEHFNLSERWIRTLLAQYEIEPDELVKSAQGKASCLYNMNSVHIIPQLQSRNDQKTGEQFNEAMTTGEGRAKLEAAVITSRYVAGDITQDQLVRKIEADQAVRGLVEAQAQRIDELSLSQHKLLTSINKVEREAEYKVKDEKEILRRLQPILGIKGYGDLIDSVRASIKLERQARGLD